MQNLLEIYDFVDFVIGISSDSHRFFLYFRTKCCRFVCYLTVFLLPLPRETAESPSSVPPCPTVSPARRSSHTFIYKGSPLPAKGRTRHGNTWSGRSTSEARERRRPPGEQLAQGGGRPAQETDVPLGRRYGVLPPRGSRMASGASLEGAPRQNVTFRRGRSVRIGSRVRKMRF